MLSINLQRPWLKAGLSITIPGQFREKKNLFTLICGSANTFGSMPYSLMNLYRGAILVVVQVEERNMYEQHYISALLRDKYPFLISYNYDTKGKI